MVHFFTSWRLVVIYSTLLSKTTSVVDDLWIRTFRYFRFLLGVFPQNISWKGQPPDMQSTRTPDWITLCFDPCFIIFPLVYQINLQVLNAILFQTKKLPTRLFQPTPMPVANSLGTAGHSKNSQDSWGKWRLPNSEWSASLVMFRLVSTIP